MSPFDLLVTSALLGLFVLLAGGYGVFYALGRLHDRRGLIAAAFASYGLQCVVAAALLAFTPLLGGWKALIAASCVLYLPVPPLTWRYMGMLHHP